MRISDGSSDVCSSDLAPRSCRGGSRASRRAFRACGRRWDGWRRFSARATCGRAIRQKSPSFFEPAAELEQGVARDDLDLPGVEAGDAELAVAGTDQAADLEAEMFEDAAHLTVLAFRQRQLDPLVEIGRAHG